MDGDEEPRSDGVVKRTDAPERVDGAAGSEPVAAGAAAEPDAVEPDALVEPDAVVHSEAVGEPEAVAEPEVVEAAESVAEESVVARPARRRVSLRRGLAVAGVALVAALAVSAFSSSVAPSGGDADQHFVDTAHLQGRVIDAVTQQTLLVSAAHKICDRRESHATVAQRRATALSSEELDAIEKVFAGDSRGFTVLALDTYCPS